MSESLKTRLEQIGTTVREIRNAKGLTLEELGVMSKVSYRTIRNFENGMCFPKLDTLLKLEDALGIPLAVVFAESNEKSFAAVCRLVKNGVQME